MELVAFLVVPFVFILILSTYKTTSHTSLKVDPHTGVGTRVMFLYFSRLTCFFCYFGIFKIGFEEEQRQHSSEDHQAWTKVSYRIWILKCITIVQGFPFNSSSVWTMTCSVHRSNSLPCRGWEPTILPCPIILKIIWYILGQNGSWFTFRL